MICAMTRRQWQSLGQATGLSGAFADLAASVSANLDIDTERFEHRHAIDALIGQWVSAHAFAEVAERFEAAGVLWGPYRTFKELVAAEPRAAGPFGTPLQFSGFSHDPGTSPVLGGDADTTLRSVLGLDDAEISSLRTNGVIG
jgi:2-methylfumaryl-CoA isomerase